ncbi:MAG: hypothetical protein N2483_10650 [Burkholderiaceae bacterium]|nr:hypothetical protein [Burkholderiaceae bacterium]
MRTMRTMRAFILRLLLDSDDPTVLRGALRAVDAPEEHTFADAERLLALYAGGDCDPAVAHPSAANAAATVIWPAMEGGFLCTGEFLGSFWQPWSVCSRCWRWG